MKAARWKTVPDRPKYEVSSDGRVRVRIASRTAPVGFLPVIKIDHFGYPVVHLYDRNWHKSRRVHVLMAMAFYGYPKEGQEVRHLNGVKSDCRIENLRYGTRSENMKDSYVHNPDRKTPFVKGHKLGLRFGAGQRTAYEKLDYQEIARKAWQTRYDRYGAKGHA